VDTILGPEMKSTGEVMGLDRNFPRAFGKATLATGSLLPQSGRVFISVMDADKDKALEVAKALASMGFTIVSTKGTAAALAAAGIAVDITHKVGEGSPTCVDLLKSGEICFVINTTSGKKSIEDSYTIRRTALIRNIPYFTTIEGAEAGALAIQSRFRDDMEVRSIQEYFEDMKKAATGS